MKWFLKSLDDFVYGSFMMGVGFILGIILLAIYYRGHPLACLGLP